MPQGTTTVAVVGGGAVGVTAARDLAARGADVTLFERGDVASGASGRAAGIVYDAFAEDVDAAVADRAIERFRALDADPDSEFAFRECPYVWFAREGDERRARAVRESVAGMERNGRDVERLDGPDALADRVPALAGVDVETAAVARNAGVVDTTAYVRAMADRARAAGATLRTGVRVELADDGTAVAFGDGHEEAFDAVLVAAGAHTKRLLGTVDLQIPLKPYRVQALVTDPFEGVRDLPTVYDATRGRYARPHGAGALVGDGTQEREFDPDDYERAADPAFERESLAWLAGTLDRESTPTLDRSWAGLCTATPDRDPLVGRVADDRPVFVATGFQGHGFMRSPAIGERVAGQVLGEDGIEAFDPRRFDGDETFEVVEGMTVDE